MDLRKFYQKLRDVEQKIEEAFPVIVTHETPDGGQPGQTAQVTKSQAAKLVVEGKAHLADAVELAAYNLAMDQARQQAQQIAVADKIQIRVVSEPTPPVPPKPVVSTKS